MQTEPLNKLSFARKCQVQRRKQCRVADVLYGIGHATSVAEKEEILGRKDFFNAMRFDVKKDVFF